MSVIDFATLVRRAWGDEFNEPDDAYKFSGRTFKDAGRYGGIYVISTAVAPNQYGINAGGVGDQQDGYTIVWTDANLKKTRPIDAGEGAYAFTGVAAETRKGAAIGAAQGAVALTGIDAGLYVNLRRAVPTAQSFALAAPDVTLTKAPKSAGTITAEAGAFALTGRDVFISK